MRASIHMIASLRFTEGLARPDQHFQPLGSSAHTSPGCAEELVACSTPIEVRGVAIPERVHALVVPPPFGATDSAKRAADGVLRVAELAQGSRTRLLGKVRSHRVLSVGLMMRTFSSGAGARRDSYLASRDLTLAPVHSECQSFCKRDIVGWVVHMCLLASPGGHSSVRGGEVGRGLLVQSQPWLG